MSSESEVLIARIRKWLGFFIVMLVLSGVTAFPLETELRWLSNANFLPGPIQMWVNEVYWAVSNTNENYPYLAYGTDWLAFAHLVIATVFIGPYRDPVRNKWVIQFGMIACLMVFPLALIAGPIRGIPFYWQMIDCSFGIIGLVPLRMIYRNILTLERLKEEKTKDTESKLAYYEQVLIPKMNKHVEVN